MFHRDPSGQQLQRQADESLHLDHLSAPVSAPPSAATQRAVQRHASGPLPAVADLGAASGERSSSPSDRAYGSVQRRDEGGGGGGQVQEIAARGVDGPGSTLPHLDRIQASFGASHDVSGIQSHVGGGAAQASEAIGAAAYATGSSVAFRQAPDLHLAAHEAAHVVQQRAGVHLSGGVGQAGDPYERHADAVADAVVAGHSASGLLDQMSGGGGGGGATQRSEVQLKKKEKPEIEATPEAIGGHVVEKMNTANHGTYNLDAGIHYSYNYESETERAGKKELWKDEYRYGHNASGHFKNPWELGQFMTWELKPGHSASEGIQAWLKGLTVAECLSAVVAMEIDSVRASIGNDKFDRLFGSKNAKTDKAIPEHRRLAVRPGIQGTPCESFIKQPELTKKDEELKAEGKELTPKDFDTLLKPGEWYYFYNHPKYLLKHPGGAWQGENAIYMGKNGAGEQEWTGLGAANKTFDAMVDEMVHAYGGDRDKHDERTMKERGVKKDDGTYVDKKYDPKGGEFSDQVTKEQILKDPAYTIDGTTRKGGFLPEAGVALDADKLKALRDKK